jgi:hypothetical protein
MSIDQEDRMDTKDRLSRIAPLCGALFVVLELAGVIVGATGGRSMAALGDPMPKILKSFHDPVGTGVWIGAYLEVAAMAAFGLFAIWIFRQRRGLPATAGVVTATLYVTATFAALVTGDALAYGSAHGLGDQSLLALFYLQSGLFFGTWGVAALFLLLVPAEGWLRRSAIVIAGLLLLAMAFPTAGPSQFPNMLFLIWVFAESVALARRRAAFPAPGMLPSVRTSQPTG